MMVRCNSTGEWLLKNSFVIGLLCVLAPVVSYSQATSYLTGDLQEQYSSETDIRGRLLVGLWSGANSSPFDPAHLTVLVPTGLGHDVICFEATTRDGLYFADGLLRLPPGSATEYGIDDYRHSDYRKRLTTYSSDDVAPLATLGPDCGTPETHLVSRLESVERVLHASLNTRSSEILEASLNASEDLQIAGSCASKENSRNISFDKVCSFTLPDDLEAKSLTLYLKRKPRAGPKRVDEFAITLP